MKNKKELLKKEKICNVKNLNKRKKDQEKNQKMLRKKENNKNCKRNKEFYINIQRNKVKMNHLKEFWIRN